MKVVLTTVIGVLAVLQVVGALWLYGKLGIRAPSWLGTAHRISGITALLLSVFVAYHCLWALGLETGRLHGGPKVPMRTVVHGVLGCAVFGAVVVKVAAVRSRRAPGWFLPVAGGLLFALLIAVVLTSAGWYLNSSAGRVRAATDQAIRACARRRRSEGSEVGSRSTQTFTIGHIRTVGPRVERALAPTRRGHNVRSRRLGGGITCVRADSAGA